MARKVAKIQLCGAWIQVWDAATGRDLFSLNVPDMPEDESDSKSDAKWDAFVQDVRQEAFRRGYTVPTYIRPDGRINLRIG